MENKNSQTVHLQRPYPPQRARDSYSRGRSSEYAKIILIVFNYSLINPKITHIHIELRASFALRRHFCSRSTDLIAPLARYLNSLIPSPQEVSRARSSKDPNLRLKPFSSQSFFASLKANGCTLPFKSAAKRVQFYERCVCMRHTTAGGSMVLIGVSDRWLKSPGFGVWLARQEAIVQDILNTPINPTASPSLS